MLTVGTWAQRIHMESPLGFAAWAQRIHMDLYLGFVTWAQTIHTEVYGYSDVYGYVVTSPSLWCGPRGRGCTTHVHSWRGPFGLAHSCTLAAVAACVVAGFPRVMFAACRPQRELMWGPGP